MRGCRFGLIFRHPQCNLTLCRRQSRLRIVRADLNPPPRHVYPDSGTLRANVISFARDLGPFRGCLGAPVTSLAVSSAIEAIYQVSIARLYPFLALGIDNVVRSLDRRYSFSGRQAEIETTSHGGAPSLGRLPYAPRDLHPWKQCVYGNTNFTKGTHSGCRSDLSA